MIAAREQAPGSQPHGHRWVSPRMASNYCGGGESRRSLKENHPAIAGSAPTWGHLLVPGLIRGLLPNAVGVCGSLPGPGGLVCASSQASVAARPCRKFEQCMDV